MFAIEFQRFAVHEIPLPFIEPEDPHLGRDVAQIAALVEDQAQRYFVARVVDMAQELDQRLFGTAAAQFEDAENLWDSPQFPMDAIDVNGRVALTIACSGIDARVARDVHKYSESPLLDGKGSYIYSLAVNFLFKGIGTHWTITLDDVTTEGDWSLVSVCNGRYYGGGFMPVAEARMDDGVLNPLVVREVNRRTFLKFVGPYSRGEYAKFPEYAHCSCPKVVHIHSEKPDIVTCLDGESVVNSDVTIKLHDKKLNFFGPEGCSCNRTARG